MFASGRKVAVGMTYVNRGDLDAFDFTVGDFTVDNAWHTLDLSSIVPAGVTHVIISFSFKGSVAQETVTFQADGYSNDFNLMIRKTVIAGNYAFCSGVIACSTARKLQYKIPVSMTNLRLSVLGWILG